MAVDHPDFTALDDPQFLAERRRIRQQLERVAPDRADHPRLAALAAALDDEFDRRARAAWSASPAPPPA
jgi:hypothetical protein